MNDKKECVKKSVLIATEIFAYMVYIFLRKEQEIYPFKYKKDSVVLSKFQQNDENAQIWAGFRKTVNTTDLNRLSVDISHLIVAFRDLIQNDQETLQASEVNWFWAEFIDMWGGVKGEEVGAVASVRSLLPIAKTSSETIIKAIERLNAHNVPLPSPRKDSTKAGVALALLKFVLGLHEDIMSEATKTKFFQGVLDNLRADLELTGEQTLLESLQAQLKEQRAARGNLTDSIQHFPNYALQSALLAVVKDYLPENLETVVVETIINSIFAASGVLITKS